MWRWGHTSTSQNVYWGSWSQSTKGSVQQNPELRDREDAIFAPYPATASPGAKQNWWDLGFNSLSTKAPVSCLCGLPTVAKNRSSISLLSFPAVWPHQAGAGATCSLNGFRDFRGRRGLQSSRFSPRKGLFPGLHSDSDCALDSCLCPLSAAGLHHVWKTRGAVCI